MATKTLTQDVRIALAEDVGSGDITARLIPASTLAEARVICRENAVVCGSEWFDEVYRQLDPKVHVIWRCADGEQVAAEQMLCIVQGPARSLLTGERSALNFLQTLSGTATVTRRYADALAGTQTKILDTRKTIPGLRAAQKYAVRCGGGQNHRMGLYDAVLIKENHIAAAGSITKAVTGIRRLMGTGFKIEIEVENISQLKDAIYAGVDIALLDNMDVKTIAEAVAVTAGRVRLEASGGITLENIRDYANTGVDFISIGAITKHVRAVDLSMRFTTP
ncbi:MAG: carboxylating nicotinate-nucleotide diphosphorylase [Gammaproteobacteria bacterium]|nr:carboxylating nicotinate-nucleotide diphosphorylase [Gammaproteobacteria bacterium]